MTTHTLFVKVESATAAGKAAASRELTISVLRYIKENLQLIQTMGITIQVRKILDKDLKDDRVIKMLRERGITRLPALCTSQQVYIGAKSIIDLYDKNLKSFQAERQKKQAPPKKAVAAPDIESYFNREMMATGHDDDDDENMNEGGDNMMDTYRQVVSRRDGSAGPPRGHATNRMINDDEDMSARPPTRSSMRPNNVAPSRQNTPAKTSGPPARTSEPPPRTGGPPVMGSSSGGGPASGSMGGFDDDENSPQDDLMERAYFANMDDSLQDDPEDHKFDD